jgi:hypothetical protein
MPEGVGKTNRALSSALGEKEGEMNHNPAVFLLVSEFSFQSS